MNLQNKFFSVFMLLVLGATFLFLYRCSQSDNNSETSGNAAFIAGLVAQYNAGESIDEFKAIFMEGSMSVLTLPSKEVLFFLKRTDNSAVNDIFICQNNQLETTLNEDLGNVYVAYLREALVIQTTNGKTYVFSIGERKGHEIAKNISADWSITGYGLAFWMNRSDDPSSFKGYSSLSEKYAPGDPDKASSRSSVNECQCVEYQVPRPPDGDSNCNSGGYGSSSCSITGTTTQAGCSTNCSGNYYACCTNAIQ